MSLVTLPATVWMPFPAVNRPCGSFAGSGRGVAVGLVDGQVVLVTGGAGGMGRAGAVKFAAEGAAHVYVLDLKVAEGHQTIDLIEQAGGAGTFLETDVTDDASVGAAVARMVGEHG